MNRYLKKFMLSALMLFGFVSAASAQTVVPKIDTGDTAWVLVSTALVLLMLMVVLSIV